MPLKKNDLFGWERFSKPRVYSRSQVYDNNGYYRQFFYETTHSDSVICLSATHACHNTRTQYGHLTLSSSASLFH